MRMTRWISAAILSIAITAPSAVLAETVVIKHRGPHWHHGWHHHEWHPRWHRDWHHHHHRHETVIIRRH